MKKLSYLFLALVFTGCFGCTIPGQETGGSDDTLVLMTWNIHNLFNGKDDGNEYDEFLSSSGWSQEKYLGRLNSISEAISGLTRIPDIILLQELESLEILEDLAASISQDFQWSFFASNSDAALGLGIISRLPLGECTVHSITIDDETSPRPVIEINFKDDDDENNIEEKFVLFINHWKSKLGGDDATENLRRACARVILRRICELQKEDPNLGFIVAGDLNICHDDFYRRGADIITALMLDEPYCAQLAAQSSAQKIYGQNDFFILSKNKPPTVQYFSDECIAFYSPWLDELENGSYYYAYNWETIDHFLLSSAFFNEEGWEYKNAEVINFPPFANANGIPVGYNVRTGNGLSDHLPLIITLKKIDTIR